MVDELIKNVIYLLDFNGLYVEADLDTPVESLQEISFYALLALINFSLDNIESRLRRQAWSDKGDPVVAEVRLL